MPESWAGPGNEAREGLGCTNVQDRMGQIYETRGKYPGNHFVAAKISQNENVNPANYPGCLFVNLEALHVIS